MIRFLKFAFVVILMAALPAIARELYVVQGRGGGAPLGGGTFLLYTTDALFLNGGAANADIRVLGVSNGGASGLIRDISLPPGRSASLVRMMTLSSATPSALWVVRLDVPSDVKVESVLFIGSFFDIGTAPPSESPYRFGKLRLPVFTTLTPAGTPQRHLATYLGTPEDIPNRLNVAVYNAAAVPANALIEIRQHCDDTLITSQTVSVPADTLLQFGSFSATEQQCPAYLPGTLGGPLGSVYTVVTVDQPSLTFVSNLANREIPTTSISITLP